MSIDNKSNPIPLLAFGKSWLAVDKPAGMSIHNEPRNDLCSLISACIQNRAAIHPSFEMDQAFGVNPVHRLDKETSGVTLLALTRALFRFFSNQFESRQVKKRYIAILHGMLEKPQGESPWGTWNRPLAKSAGGRNDPEGTGPRQESRTLYRVLGHSAHYTMVEIELLTGRKHQIRRHAKLSGHPVAGDARYGSTRALNYLSRNHSFNRLALHAQSLTIRLPGEKTPATIETPAIPFEILELFQNDSDAPKPQDHP